MKFKGHAGPWRLAKDFSLKSAESHKLYIETFFEFKIKQSNEKRLQSFKMV